MSEVKSILNPGDLKLMLDLNRIQNLVQSYSVQERCDPADFKSAREMAQMCRLSLCESRCEASSPRKMFAATVYQRCFNEFDGREIVEDLAKYDSLWHSFIFSRPLYLDDEHGMGFSALIEVLLIMGNRKPTAETIFPQEFVYPGDTLFVLARNADTIVSQLMSLGEKWRASEIFIYDGYNREFKPDLQQILHYKLNRSLWGEPGEDWEDAVIMSFWWD